MNSPIARRVAQLLLALAIAESSMSLVQAQNLDFSKELSSIQKSCLRQLLRQSWTPQFHGQMMKIAQVATTTLNHKAHPNFAFLFEAAGWCGTAGCPLLIGELEPDGNCRLLYAAAADGVFVLRRRDHGYRRIWTPCEARYDGRQYQQLHEDCPTPDVPR